jgi:hypothetical protein
MVGDSSMARMVSHKRMMNDEFITKFATVIPTGVPTDIPTSVPNGNRLAPAPRTRTAGPKGIHPTFPTPLLCMAPLILAISLLAIPFLAISANLHAAPAQESSAQETPSSQPATVSNPSLNEKSTGDEKTIGAQESVTRIETDESAANPQPQTTDTGKAPSAALLDNGVAEEPSSLMGWGALLIVIGLFVLPALLGNYFAKQFRMPEHGWKFGLVLGTLAAACVIVSLGEIKFGPDLSGGITLIYELQDTSTEASKDQQNQNPVGTPGAEDSDAAGELRERARWTHAHLFVAVAASRCVRASSAVAPGREAA